MMIFQYPVRKYTWDTGIRGLMRGMASIPQGNQQLLMVRDKVGRPPGELGVSKSMDCDIFPISALTLLVGRQEGHSACKKDWRCWCVYSFIWYGSLKNWIEHYKSRPIHWQSHHINVGLLVVMIWLQLCTISSSTCHHCFHPLLQ